MSWTTKPATINNSGLVINNHSVVEKWEKPIQEKLANSIIGRTKGSILEIGYGLGYSSLQIAKSKPQKHVLIEAHEEIAQLAKNTLPNSDIVPELWEDVIDSYEESSFDGIVFDAYPLENTSIFDGSKESTFAQVLPFLIKAKKILKKGGYVSFLDFSCKVHQMTKFKESIEHLYDGFEIITCPIKVPKSCTYAKSRRGNIIVVKN